MYKAPAKGARLELFVPEKVRNSLEDFSKKSFQALNMAVTTAIKNYLDTVPIHEQPEWATKSIDPSPKTRLSARIPNTLKVDLEKRCKNRGEKSALVIEAIKRYIGQKV
jgi:hypothetical protein